jgi:amino acid transporter
VFIAVAALFSTGSAINGTLFSAAHFTKGMLSDDLVPDRLGGADGAPTRAVVVLGGLAAVLAATVSLEGITSFGSLAFMVVFGTMCWLAFRQRDHDAINPVVPAIGVIGNLAFAPLLLWHLYRREFGVLVTVGGITVAILAVELAYFERETIPREVESAADAVPSFDD